MNYKQRKLMISFTKKSKIKDFLNYLSKNKITEKAFVLTSNKDNELIVSYCIYDKVDLSNLKHYGVLNTLNVQRSKESNTIYTLNSLNILLEELRLKTGQKEAVKIDWNNYKNLLLVTSNKKLQVIETRLLKIFYLNNGFDVNRISLDTDKKEKVLVNDDNWNRF